MSHTLKGRLRMSKLKKPDTLANRLTAIKQLEEVDVPWAFNGRLGFNVELFGSQIGFTNNGDFVSLEDARKVFEYYVTQFGGTVKWD